MYIQIKNPRVFRDSKPKLEENNKPITPTVDLDPTQVILKKTSLIGSRPNFARAHTIQTSQLTPHLISHTLSSNFLTYFISNYKHFMFVAPDMDLAIF